MQLLHQNAPNCTHLHQRSVPVGTGRTGHPSCAYSLCRLGGPSHPGLPTQKDPPNCPGCPNHPHCLDCPGFSVVLVVLFNGRDREVTPISPVIPVIPLDPIAPVVLYVPVIQVVLVSRTPQSFGSFQLSRLCRSTCCPGYLGRPSRASCPGHPSHPGCPGHLIRSDHPSCPACPGR